MNAKQRRKLLRAQLQRPQDASDNKTRNIIEKVKDQVERQREEKVVTPVATQGDDGQCQTTRPVDKNAEVATDECENDQVKLNAQQRRLLKRRAKRKLEGVDEKHRERKKHLKEHVRACKSIHLTLFVGQLPFRATEGMIRKHFAEAGEIKLRMMTDKKTNEFKGTAFIEVKDNKALGAALSRHHTLLLGRRINVELTASGGGTKSEMRRNKIDLLRKKQSAIQVKKTKALIQKHIADPEYLLKQEDVDDRMIDFLSWFDYETAKHALEEYNRCVRDNVVNRKAFFMGILKRFRQTDGVE
ncbi:hypothetical protein PsorP6_009459 [Peronosclerospora sorghi]|uniref:Uncharacterized protein n=1 Tax=Peronosclerospora sorghi TaxID=230839 RepID=A0ACC0W1K0_9STRA|nr:hypothetical protein PsorP6_009459 [Peronosclerospora sorghi]